MLGLLLFKHHLVVSENVVYGFLISDGPKINKYGGNLKLPNYKHYTEILFPHNCLPGLLLLLH